VGVEAVVLAERVSGLPLSLLVPRADASLRFPRAHWRTYLTTPL